MRFSGTTTIRLVADRPGQQVPILAAICGPDAPQVSGFNLRAQIVDDAAIGLQPVFQAVDYTGGIWDAFPVLTMAA